MSKATANDIKSMLMSKINELNLEIRGLEVLAYRLDSKADKDTDSLYRDAHIYRKALKDFYEEIKNI